MDVIELSLLTRFRQKSGPWLFGIVIGLIALHSHLLWRLNGSLEQLSLSLFFWSFLVSLLWKKRHFFHPENDRFSSFIGLFVIVLVLVRSLSIYTNDTVLFNILPIFSAFGVGLLAVGIRRLKQYWRELLLPSCLKNN